MADRIKANSPDIQQNLFGAESTEAKSSKHSNYAVMYCDGASSGNPGRSGIGVVIYIGGIDEHNEGLEETCRISEHIGTATNNVAEYSALIRGLKESLHLGIKKIDVFLDSELLVRQVQGIYKVKNKGLIPLWSQVMTSLKHFERYNISHVRREMNKEADSLARQGALDSVIQ